MAGPPSSTPSPIGSSICGYEVVERLGAGGMGVVYRAVDRRLGRSVALKLLAEARSADPQVRERFLREARTASALDHPNVGTIYGIEEMPDGGICIVMAYYEGKTVHDRMAARKQQPAEILSIGIQAADGLAAAHSAGIIHRDVKPSNIMLSASGMVKVVDFGLAKLAEAGDESLTHTAAVVGTAAYMSPEQARGRPLDARTDIWSLGVTLYEMAAGRLPFQGPDVYAQLYSAVHDDPPPSGVFSELEAAIRKALAKEPGERYSSMAEFAAELRRVAGQLKLTDGLETTELVCGPALDLTTAPSRSRLGIDVSGPRASASGIRDAALARAAQPLPNRRRRALAGAGALALLLAALTVAIPSVRQRLFPAGSSGAAHTVVAVLPFTGGDDPGLTALAGGLAHGLSARLARLEGVRDSFSILTANELSGRNIQDAGQAVQRLGATLVVSGSLQRSGNGHRLSIEVRDRSRLRPETAVVEREQADIGALEDRAVAEVARLLQIHTDARVSAALWRTGTSAAAAYEPYLRGVGYLQRWDKADNLGRSLEAFAEAVRADPQFALAHAGLAEASRTRYTRDKDPADMQSALGHAQEALRLAPRLAEAHVALGRVYQGSGQRDLAAEEFRRTLELDPRNPDGMIGTARSYEELGREAEAEAAFRKAIELRPYWWNSHNALASYYVRKGRYADAEAQYRAALRVTPDNGAVYSNLGAVLTLQDKPAEAIKMFRKSLELGPGYQAYANLANAYYRERKFREAAENYAKALELNGKDFRVWGSRGQALRHGGGARVETEQSLRRAIALGEQQLQVSPGDGVTLGLLAVYHGLLGEKEAALAVVNQAMTRSKLTGKAAALCAMAYELAGDRAAAVRWAQTALDTGYPWKELRADVEMDELVRSSRLRQAR